MRCKRTYEKMWISKFRDKFKKYLNTFRNVFEKSWDNLNELLKISVENF